MDMESQVEIKFSEFYEEWMGQLEGHLRLLLAAPLQQHLGEGGGLESIVKKLTAHHKDYYKFKWAAAQQDVLAFFTPHWLSPLEKAHLWMTGWKPSTAFLLVDKLKAAALSEEQARGIEALRGRIRAEEEREMERHQVAMADRKMVEIVRLEGIVRLVAGLEKVMKMAGCVRLKTMKGVLDLLTPAQCVQYLAATSMFQIQMRKWGNTRNKPCSCNQNHLSFINTS